MEFILKIKLGNEAMETPSDVAQALRETADKVERLFGRFPSCGCDGSLRDVNGNTVGEFKVR